MGGENCLVGSNPTLSADDSRFGGYADAGWVRSKHRPDTDDAGRLSCWTVGTVVTSFRSSCSRCWRSSGSPPPRDPAVRVRPRTRSAPTPASLTVSSRRPSGPARISVGISSSSTAPRWRRHQPARTSPEAPRSRWLPRLGSSQRAAIAATRASGGDVVYRYDTLLNGFSAQMSARAASELAGRSDVASVQPVAIVQKLNEIQRPVHRRDEGLEEARCPGQGRRRRRRRHRYRLHAQELRRPRHQGRL